jgi:ABC-type spermidine/putrescine transport system permease subunit I
MLKRLRENKSSQGTLLVTPTLVFMVGLLIIPLILTLIISFGRRSADGNVIYTFGLHNYSRILGISTTCEGGRSVCFDPLYAQIPGVHDAALIDGLVILLAYPLAYLSPAASERRNTFHSWCSPSDERDPRICLDDALAHAGGD